MELLFDDQWIDCVAGVRRVIARPVKHAGPVLEPQAAWETHGVQPHMALHRTDDGKFRLWYRGTVKAQRGVGDQASVDLSERQSGERREFLCFAQSDDGVSWDRPALSLFAFQGRRENNILLELDEGDSVFWNVLHDEAETDPTRRFKALGFQAGNKTSRIRGATAGGNGIAVAYSSDGLRWGESKLVMRTADVTDSNSMFPQRDPVTGKWVGFFRPRTQPKRRFIGMSTSDDFERWTYPRMVLTPDCHDADSTEFYGLATTAVGQYRIGCLWIFHNQPDHSPMTVELVYSRDGINYQRVAPGQEFLPLGQADSFDSQQIVPVALLRHENELLIYYSGSNTDHGSDRNQPMQENRQPEGGTKRSGMGLAKLPLNHLAGFHAPFSGTVETKWLTYYGRDGIVAAVSLDSGGSVMAEIIDPFGQVIPGWDVANCHVIWEGHHMRFTWGSDGMAGHPGQESVQRGKIGHVIKLRFYLRGATLWGFQAGNHDATPDYE